MADERIFLAARNNARLYQSVCNAHGCPTQLEDALLRCEGDPPRYFSNLVTLSPGTQSDLDKFQPWLPGFKDSFHDVDASRHGMAVLFTAEWIWRPPATSSIPNLNWSVVSTDADLLAWEAAWAAGDDDAVNFPRQFPPSLLADDSITFLSAYREKMPVAGCILNLSDSVVGVSNVYAVGIGYAEIWSDFGGIIPELYPGRPTVGYERGEALTAGLKSGFESIGPLRVWVRSG